LLDHDISHLLSSCLSKGNLAMRNVQEIPAGLLSSSPGDKVAGMRFDELLAAARSGHEPPGLTPVLRALWLDGSGDWDAAHQLADDIGGADGARVHAYLHRKEGDLSNARYWYRQANCQPFDGSLDEEWAALARDFLGDPA
jgi:hypothetical protein